MTTEWICPWPGMHTAERHGMKLDVFLKGRVWWWRVTTREGGVAMDNKPTAKEAKERAELWADAIHGGTV